ncbi:hypothetical protein STRDD11_00347 [Streptococcus sp. DD11]|nr:hypothetical protein STRDD11_00347 [Streptococcus sp. DD11]
MSLTFIQTKDGKRFRAFSKSFIIPKKGERLACKLQKLTGRRLLLPENMLEWT